MTILLDADGVLENLTEEWVALLNEKYGTSVAYDDVTDWDMTKSFPTLTYEQVYGVEIEEALYLRLKPLEGAVESVNRLLDEGHEVFVVTSTPYQIIPFKMENVIFRYFPRLNWENIIITYRKQLIKGDVLVDDGFHNLVDGAYHKLLMDAPYNRQYDAAANGMIRVYNWKEINEQLERITRGIVPLT